MSTDSAVPTIPFGAGTRAREVLAGVDLTGRRAIVTGAASGIGRESARELLRAGAEVTLAVRDPAVGAQVAAELGTSTGRAAPQVAALDLSDPASVAAFVAAWAGPLDILLDNAGVMATPLRRTAAGWELQFATNHIGHFQLTTGLHDALAAAGSARVVVVSSVGHVNGGVLFDAPTSNGRRTTPGSPTASPRRRTCCSRSKRPGGGPATGSPSTP